MTNPDLWRTTLGVFFSISGIGLMLAGVQPLAFIVVLTGFVLVVWDHTRVKRIYERWKSSR